MTCFVFKNQAVAKVDRAGPTFSIELSDTERSLPFERQSRTPFCLDCVAIPLDMVKITESNRGEFEAVAGMKSLDPVDPGRATNELFGGKCPYCKRPHAYRVPMHTEGSNHHEF